MAKAPKFKPPKIDFSQGMVNTLNQNPWKGASGDLPPAPPPAATPSFDEILAKDPYYQAALANLNAQGVYDKTSRDQIIRQAMIRFGYAPEAVANMTFPEPVLGQAGHVHPSTLATILDPATRSLIQQNTDAGLSIWARLKDVQDQTRKRTVDVLGSRGLFRSGETGYQLKRGTLAADQARYDATNKLMDFLTGAQAAYVQAEMQRQALLLAAQKQAAEDAANNAPPVNPHPPGVTHPGPHGPEQHPYIPSPLTDPEKPWKPGPDDPGVTAPQPPEPIDYADPTNPAGRFGWGQGVTWGKYGVGGNFKPQ